MEDSPPFAPVVAGNSIAESLIDFPQFILYQTHRFRQALNLDYGKVKVEPPFLPSFRVPGIRHYEAICDEIVRLLRQERKRRNLSNYEVSQRSGVSESMLSLVERGLRNPTLELSLRIADGIGADLPTLIKKAQGTVVKQSGKARLPRQADAPANL